MVKKQYDMVEKIMAFESGELSQSEIIELFKCLYITNTLNDFQGFYRRTFNNLIETGLINMQQLKEKKKIYQAEKQI